MHDHERQFARLGVTVRPNTFLDPDEIASHDADVVNLYFQESFTYLTHTGEAAVALFGG